MQEHELPTAAEILHRAAEELAEAREAVERAADWLRSDWGPPGSSLTDSQAASRSIMGGMVAESRKTLAGMNNIGGVDAFGERVRTALAQMLISLESADPRSRHSDAAAAGRAALGVSPEDYLAARGITW